MLDEYILNTAEQVKAFGDVLRLRILDLLTNQSMTGSHIARQLGIPRQKVHYHLRILKDAGLIVVQKEGSVKGLRELYYRSIARSFRLPEKTTGNEQKHPVENAIELLSMTFLRQLQIDLTNYTKSINGKGFFSTQETCDLTAEQIREIMEELSRIRELVNQYNWQNHEQQLYPLQTIRLTIFHIPISGSGNKENQEN